MDSDFLPTLDTALAMTQERIDKAPDADPFPVILAQLGYLRAVVTGEESDLSRLEDIAVGRYGTSEFATNDPEYAQILVRAQAIARLFQDSQI